MDVFTQFDDALSHTWQEALRRHLHSWPFYSYEWHSAWHTHFGDGEQIHIVTDPTKSSIIPLSVHDGTAHFTGGEEIADYLDCLGEDGTVLSTWTDAVASVRSIGASGLLLRNIPDGSATLRYFSGITGAAITKEDTTPFLILPETFERYESVLPRKERHELKRKRKRFIEMYPDYSFTASETPDMDLVLSMMRNNENKRIFLNDANESFFRHLPKTLGASVRQFTLSVRETPVAVVVGILSGESMLLYNSGYIPDYLGSGWFCKTEIIRWCIEQTECTTVNFLQGNERYKYDLGAVDLPVYRIEMPL